MLGRRVVSHWAHSATSDSQSILRRSRACEELITAFRCRKHFLRTIGRVSLTLLQSRQGHDACLLQAAVQWTHEKTASGSGDRRDLYDLGCAGCHRNSAHHSVHFALKAAQLNSAQETCEFIDRQAETATCGGLCIVSGCFVYRWGVVSTTHDLLLGKETFYH
jgi:hypothetical protein